MALASEKSKIGPFSSDNEEPVASRIEIVKIDEIDKMMDASEDIEVIVDGRQRESDTKSKIRLKETMYSTRREWPDSRTEKAEEILLSLDRRTTWSGEGLGTNLSRSIPTYSLSTNQVYPTPLALLWRLEPNWRC